MMQWLLLTYSLPSEPSAPRVYIWRKLRKAGAEILSEAVWALPFTARNHEQFLWLAAEIQELGGKAMFWKAETESIGQEEAMTHLFKDPVDQGYRDLLARIDQPGADLSVLAGEYQQIHLKDVFHSAIGAEVYARLLSTRGGEG
jgi:hypothetical protein